MWDKYHYFLNSPTKIEKMLWWQETNEFDTGNLPFQKSDSIDMYSTKNHRKTVIKNCYPFVLKALSKDDYSCTKCPWFKFCSGCIIDPFNTKFVEIKPSMVLMVEWCSDIIQQKEMSETNLKLILNHESIQGKEEDKTSKSIQECINLFTEKEVLDDKIYCNGACKKLTRFEKKLDFERLPPILITVLKRFKYTQMYVVLLNLILLGISVRLRI